MRLRNMELKKYQRIYLFEYEILPFYSGHIIIYITSIDLFLEKPLFGRGIKSFRNYCKKKFISLIEYVKVIHITFF